VKMAYRHRRGGSIRVLIVVAMLVALAAPLFGCSDGSELKDVTDAASRFHFKVPERWQANVLPDLITVYADKELPAEEGTGEALAIVVIQRPSVETSPTESLETVIDSRRTSRGWTNAQLSEATTLTVGGRDAYRIDVDLTEASGRDFKASYVFVRTAGRDVLIYGATPTENWDKYADEFEAIFDRWFWHVNETGEALEPAEEGSE